MAKSNPAAAGNEFRKLRERAGLSPQETAEKLAVSLRTFYRWENGESKPKKLAVEKLREIAEASYYAIRLKSHDFRYIDLFAGVGGFRKAFDSIGGKCVFTSEWDKACRTTYMQNYDCDHPVEGDIREFTKDAESLDRIPKHDLLVGGFPCQPFSLAGVSKKNSLGRNHGFKDTTQGTLFFDVAQIIDHHRPAAFLLENVKNLVSHDKGNTFRVIRSVLQDELGYDIHYKVIDAKPWVPQHRERIFIIGFREKCDFSFDYIQWPDKSEMPSLSSILHGFNQSEEEELPFFEDGKAADKYTLSAHLWNYLKAYKAKHQAKGNGFGFSLFGPDDVARTLSARYHKDGSEILIRQTGKRPRRLTPRECARIMGFDKPGESSFKIPVSDTQAYRQFGNSVVVPLATAVAFAMKPFVLKVINDERDRSAIELSGLVKSA